MNPKATIILPAWNAEEHIVKSLNSIQNQTFTDFECIVVDDGSTDNTYDIASAIIKDDNRFKIIQTPHEGLSNARNVGIENALADVVFHIDADDEAMPEMVERAFNFLTENDLEMVLFNAVPVVDPQLKSIRKSVYRYFTRKGYYKIASGKEMLARMTFNNEYVYAAFLHAIRKSAIRRKFIKGLRVQDMLYTTQNLYLAENVGYLQDTLYIKNTIPSSISHSRHDVNYILSLQKIIDELQKFGEEQQQNEYMIGLERVICKVFQSIASALSELNENDWNEIRNIPFNERIRLISLGNIVCTSFFKRKLKRMQEEYNFV